MIRYANDLYPRTDPRDGARILRFADDEIVECEWIAEDQGTGSGMLTITTDGDAAASLDPLGLQYHRIVEIDEGTVDGGTLSGFAERVVFGYFDDSGQFPVLDATNLRHLPMGGAGVLSYLDRARMAPHSYISITTAHDGFDPYDRLWRLFSAGTGSLAGQILWRVIKEAQAFRSGTTPYEHRHMPEGVDFTDIHDDDRVDQSAIPDVILDFDLDEDSHGNPWSIELGEFTAQIGESVLSVVKRLMESGLYVSLDPDTFELHACEGHARDQTGGAWGAGVVRFQTPTDETTATGNIFANLTRTIRAYIRRTTQWAGGRDDIFGAAHAAGDVPWEGFYQSDISDEAALEALAAEQIEVRDDAADAIRFPSIPLDDPTNGYYRPLHDDGVQLADLVTVHSGSDEWDFNERTFPVAAIGAKLRQGGDWDVWYDLGSSYAPVGDRRFDVDPPGLVGSGIELCDPFQPGSGDEELYHLHWADGLAETVDIYPSGTGSWPVDTGTVETGSSPGSIAHDADSGHVRATLATTGENSPHLPVTAGETYRFEWDGKYPGYGFRIDFYNVSDVLTGRTFYYPAADVWESFSDDLEAPAGSVYCIMFPQGRSDMAHVRITHLGTGEEEQNPYNGVSTRASRCDHTHPATAHEHNDLAAADHTHPLVTLVDVDQDDTPADGDILVWDAANEEWVFQPQESPGSSSLEVAEADGGEDVSDVTRIEFGDDFEVTDDGGGQVTVEFIGSAGGGGGATHSYVGYNTIGASTETVTTRRHYTKQITLASAGVLLDIEAHIQGIAPNNHAISFGIWEDESGSPGHLLQVATVTQDTSSSGVYLQESTVTDGDFRWFGAALGKYLAAGTYWIGFRCIGATIIVHKETTGSDKIWTATIDDITEGANGIWTISDSTDNYSIRASLLEC